MRYRDGLAAGAVAACPRIGGAGDGLRTGQCVAAPGGSQSQGEFELGRRPISRELYQRLQQYQRRRRLPGEPPRGRQQQGGRRMPGNYPQDFFGLLGGKRRTLLE